MRFHAGSANVPARIFLARQAELAPGEECLAQIRFESSPYLFAGDHFVIRDSAEQLTLASGVVLEPRAFRRHFDVPNRLSVLQQQMKAVSNPVEAFAAVLRRNQVWAPKSVLEQSHFSTEEITGALTHLGGQGKVVLSQDLAVETSEWKRLLETARAAVHAYHLAHPEQSGLPTSELASMDVLRTKWLGHSQEIVHLLLSELLKTGFQQIGPVIKAASHQPALPNHLKAAGSKIRAVLSLKPLGPAFPQGIGPNRSGGCGPKVFASKRRGGPTFRGGSASLQASRAPLNSSGLISSNMVRLALANCVK